MEITENKLKWLESELERLVKGDIGEELSDFTIIEDLHYSCKSDEDYRRVIDYLKNNPNAKRNDLIVLFINIRKRNHN